MGDSLTVAGTSEATILAVNAVLGRQGIRVVRSFDLRQAITAHEDECQCPYHGTIHCTCQFVVLLAYGDDADPVVITAHTHADATHLRALPGSNTPPHRAVHARVDGALRSLNWRDAPSPHEPPLSISP